MLKESRFAKFLLWLIFISATVVLILGLFGLIKPLSEMQALSNHVRWWGALLALLILEK